MLELTPFALNGQAQKQAKISYPVISPHQSGGDLQRYWLGVRVVALRHNFISRNHFLFIIARHHIKVSGIEFAGYTHNAMPTPLCAVNREPKPMWRDVPLKGCQIKKSNVA